MKATDGTCERVQFSQPRDVPGVETVRVESCARLWRAFHENYNVCVLIDSAGVEWRRGREVHSSASEDVLFAEPGDLTMSTAVVSPQTFVSLAISALHFENAATELELPHKQPSWRAGQLSNAWLCRKLVAHHRSLEQPDSRLEAEAAIADCVRLLFEHCVERRATLSRAPPRPSLLRVRDYLHDNYQRQFGMNELAQAVGLSRYHLSRAFTAEFGLSPHAYLIQVRLAKAKALLAQSIPVQRVAIDTGFADQSHLTRHFRCAFHTTPVQYVRAVGKAHAL